MIGIFSSPLYLSKYVLGGTWMLVSPPPPQPAALLSSPLVSPTKNPQYNPVDIWAWWNSPDLEKDLSCWLPSTAVPRSQRNLTDPLPAQLTCACRISIVLARYCALSIQGHSILSYLRIFIWHWYILSISLSLYQSIHQSINLKYIHKYTTAL